MSDILSLKDFPLPKVTKKKKQPAGRIRGHWIKGKTYYYYCRGRNKEIYLGSAEAILRAMKGVGKQ